MGMKLEVESANRPAGYFEKKYDAVLKSVFWWRNFEKLNQSFDHKKASGLIQTEAFRNFGEAWFQIVAWVSAEKKGLDRVYELW